MKRRCCIQGCKVVLHPSNRSGACEKHRAQVVCKVCGVSCGARQCAACDAVFQRISDSHDRRNMTPHHELTQRLEKYTARAAAKQPLFREPVT